MFGGRSCLLVFVFACSYVHCLCRFLAINSHCRSLDRQEYSKLSVVAGKASCNNEAVWMMSFMLWDQETQKIDSFSKSVLQQKYGPLVMYSLRKKACHCFVVVVHSRDR